MKDGLDPAHWRRRAEEARRDADKLDDPSIKETLLSIAKHYENLADLIEKNPETQQEP